MARICELDPETVDGRAILSDLATCWETARGMNKADIETKAQAAASGSKHQGPVPKRTYLAMESAYRKGHGKKHRANYQGSH